MTSGLRLTILGAAAAALLSCAMPSPYVGHRYALVYGISKYISSYADGSFPNLTFPAADAISLGSMFSQKGFDEVRVRTVDYSGNYSYTLNGSLLDSASTGAPTKANILADLADFSGILGPTDTLVFYYSGHGTQDSQAINEYIIPLGALAPNGMGGITIDYSSMINQTELADALAAISTPRKVIILDSCFSGGFIDNGLEVDLTPPAYHGTADFSLSPATIAQAIANYNNFSASGGDAISPYGNAVVLAAAGANEESWEDFTFPDGTQLQHGVMTYFLLQIPQQGDLNKDGVVTVMEAFSLVKAGIDTKWNDAGGPLFEPHVSGGPVDFVLF